MFNLNIENYNLNEMEQLLGLNKPYIDKDINNSIQNIINNITNDNNIQVSERTNIMNFLNNISQKLKMSQIVENKSSNEQNIIIKEHNNSDGRIVDSNAAPTGKLNPINYRTIKKAINIDTRFRKDYDNTSSSDLYINLPMNVKNVLSIELSSIELPLSYYAFSKELKNVSFDICNNNVDISDGNYFHDFNKNNNNMSNNIETEMNRVITDVNLSFNINNINGHSVFKNIDHNNNRIIKFNTDKSISKQMTLGWQLGFRKEQITINAGTATEVESEAICDLTGPKYMYIVVDDFNNNTNNYFQSAFSDSILNKNILARINLSSMKKTNGIYGNYGNDNFITQIHGLRKRNYFGPVDIQKLRIQLLDEYGRIIQLNNMDWSCALTFEVLYK